MRKLIVLLALLVGANAWATPDIQTWHTPNGAKVLFVNAPGLPMLDVRVVFDAGSARDGELPGLAKMTNALLSDGAGEWDANQLAERLEDRGIELSASAARDMAIVDLRSLTDEKILPVAVDTMATVLAKPSFVAKDIERTRQQMQIGLRQAKQSPGSVASLAFFKSLYGEHPYGHNSGGTEASLTEISRDDILAFHANYYVANNAVIAMVGAVDRPHAEKIAAQIVAGLPAGEHAPALPPVPEQGAQERREVFPSSQTHILVGQPGMARHDPDYFALYVGNHVLGGSGLVSVLGEEVRNKRGLSYSVYSYFSPMRQTGPFIMKAQTKNTQADQALQVMRDTLKRFIEQGPDAQELADAKRNITGGFPLRIASNQKIVQYIAMMGFYDYPLDWLATLVDKVKAVDAASVQDAFERRIDPNRMLAVIVGGEK